MSLPKETKDYLDFLSDEDLLLDLRLRFDFITPVWKKVTKKEYEANCSTVEALSMEDLEKKAIEKLLDTEDIYKKLDTKNIYKKEPHWNNVKAGLLWQIEHYDEEPDYYTYYKAVGQEHTLMLGSDMLEYLNNRKPIWFKTN